MRRGWVIAAVVLLQVGGTLTGRGTSTGSAVDQINAASRRPLPTVAAPPPPSPGMVWVPDRWVQTPDSPQGLHVPGHWEQPIAPHQYAVPPLVVCDQATGACQTLPAQTRGPVELRPSP